METIPLQKGITYGPVNSRRLGPSLGLNLLPVSCKICSFNCVYCQYGLTRNPVASVGREVAGLPKADEVENALRRALSEIEAPGFITFSGNGEPTLHPDFPAIARMVKAARDELSPSSEIALLSNSTGLALERVARAVDEFIDLPIMKLDAGDEETFQKVSRPAPGITHELVLGGLRRLEKPFTVQTVFVRGTMSNSDGPALRAWIQKIGEIKPRAVQAYSLDRPFPTRGLEIVPPSRLEEIARETNNATGVEVKTYAVTREKGENPSWS